MSCKFTAVLLAGDLYVHADLHGASSVVIKNPAGGLSGTHWQTFYFLCCSLFFNAAMR